MPWRENEGKANNVKGSTPEDERFIYVYRLAIDARPKWGDVVTGRKYPSLLEGFPDGHIINGSPETSCINRKGFLMFLSYCQIWVQEVQKVQWVQVRPIR